MGGLAGLLSAAAAFNQTPDLTADLPDERQQDPGRRYRAWREGRPQEVAVEIGAKWGRLVEVTSGLSEGERVLLNTVPLGTPQPGEHPWALAFGL